VVVVLEPPPHPAAAVAVAVTTAANATRRNRRRALDLTTAASLSAGCGQRPERTAITNYDRWRCKQCGHGWERSAHQGEDTERLYELDATDLAPD
jgi:hypothetical protein